MARMKRLEKLDGFANVQMVEVEHPKPGPEQMLIEVKRSLISRGSELFRRYVMEEAVSPEMMGYSDAGEVVVVGANIQGFAVGQRVMANTPHAQYVIASETGRTRRAFPLPNELSYETATFLPLATSSVMWMRTSPIEPGQTVVVLGQGIVGALCAQIARERDPGRVIVVDAQPLPMRYRAETGARKCDQCLPDRLRGSGQGTHRWQGCRPRRRVRRWLRRHPVFRTSSEDARTPGNNSPHREVSRCSIAPGRRRLHEQADHRGHPHRHIQRGVYAGCSPDADRRTDQSRRTDHSQTPMGTNSGCVSPALSQAGRSTRRHSGVGLIWLSVQWDLSLRASAFAFRLQMETPLARVLAAGQETL